MKPYITFENAPVTFEYLDMTDEENNPLVMDFEALMESLPVVVRASENDDSLVKVGVVISYVINSLDKIRNEMRKGAKA